MNWNPTGDSEPYEVLLLDIEGTTTPIDFVYQTLFPYARARMHDYLTSSLEPDDRAGLADEYAAEAVLPKPSWTEPPTSYLLWLMDQDRKSRGLKSVQGKIWEKGYRDGSLRGELFRDVAPALRRWKEEGKRVFIYSSGSVKAQRLLFEFSVEGNLANLIDGYFDTAVGPKRDRKSYATIAREIGVDPARVCFVSDILEECEAARAAGFQVRLAVRPGNSPQARNYPIITSFETLISPIQIETDRN